MPPKRDPTRGKTPLPNSELSSQEPADVSPPRHVSQEGDDEEYFSHADTMRIMVATDTHVGYHERDAVCHDDSFNAWDEILTLAKLNKARSLSIRPLSSRLLFFSSDSLLMVLLFPVHALL